MHHAGWCIRICRARRAAAILSTRRCGAGCGTVGSLPNSLQETTMDRNRIEGKLKQLKGSVKEALGKVTGDRETEAEGVAEQQAGKIQEKAGEAADEVRRHTGTDRH